VKEKAKKSRSILTDSRGRQRRGKKCGKKPPKAGGLTEEGKMPLSGVENENLKRKKGEKAWPETGDEKHGKGTGPSMA